MLAVNQGYPSSSCISKLKAGSLTAIKLGKANLLALVVVGLGEEGQTRRTHGHQSGQFQMPIENLAGFPFPTHLINVPTAYVPLSPLSLLAKFASSTGPGFTEPFRKIWMAVKLICSFIYFRLTTNL